MRSDSPWRPLLDHVAFRRLFFGNALSSIGTQISRLGLVLYLVAEQGGVESIAALVVVEALPGALAAPVAGVLVDRIGPRRVLFGADLVRAVCILAILIWPVLPVIVPMMAFSSVATVLFQSAKGAALPRLVTPSQLSAANGVEQSASSLVYVIGPVLGASLFTALGLTVTLWIDAATYLVSAVLVLGVRLGPVHSPATAGGPAESPSMLREIREGWRCLRGERRVLLMNGQLFIALLCTGLWMPLAPFFLRDHLGAPEPALGWQIAFFGCGSVLAGLAAPRLSRSIGQGRTVLVGLAVEATAMCLYALASNVFVSTAVLLLWGAAVSTVMVPFYALSQSLVEERFLGRVLALTKQVESVALVLATGLAVALHVLWSSPQIFLVAGLIYLILTSLSWWTRPGRALLATA